jgi:hypothetical protein
MIKRHGLAVFLFCLSSSAGIAITLLETAAAFFYSFGLPVLIGTVTILFAAVIVSWFILKGKGQIRDPERWVRHQGTAFAAWFAAHNLVWAFAASLSTWGLLKLFGFKPWVILFSAGALACTCFALMGTFLIRKGEMLGLCWQSAIPDGLGNFWAHAGATMILRERYEYAAQYDQSRPIPTLWSISRIFNRSRTGGADRAIDLLEPRREFLSFKLKKEGLHRFKVLLVLFCVTAALAALPGILGLASPHWDRVPGGWPADKTKNSPPDKPQMMASKSKPERKNENQNKEQDLDNPAQQGDRGRGTDQDQEKQSKPGGDSSETGRDGQQSNDPGQNRQAGAESGQSSSNQEQNSKENGTAQENSENSAGDSSREQKGKSDSRQGDANKSQQGKEQPGQDQKNKGSENKNQGSGESPGTEKGTDREAGNNLEQKGPNQGQQGKDNDENGKVQEQSQGQGQGQGQSQGSEGSESAESGQGGSGQNRDGQEKQGKGEGGGDGAGKDKSEEAKGSEQGYSTKSGQGGGEGKSRGEGQGLGDPNAIPETLSEPQPLPHIPSRATEMVSLELPTLKETGNPDKENENSQAKPPLDQVSPGHRPAPTAPSKAGKQERPAAKPEQYLPNWILNLLRGGGTPDLLSPSGYSTAH